MDELEKSILKTVVWFDMFNFPLTLDEIYDLRFKIYELKTDDLDKILANLVNKNILQQKQGFYFLSGRDELVEVRHERHEESLRKVKRAKKAVKFLSLLPHVKAVIVCNVLGYLNAKSEDDIDFLIITSAKRIWLARFFATGFFKLLNLRPRPGKIADQFCFSFYVTEDALNLEKIKLEDDPYFIWWFMGLLPIFDDDNYFERFLRANAWVNKFLPGFEHYYKDYKDKERDIKKFQVKGVFSLLKHLMEAASLDFDEKVYKKIQLKIMPRLLKDKMNKSDGVKINDKILKFHVDDRRREFAKEFKERLFFLSS